MQDLFGNKIIESEAKSVRVYADEIQDFISPVTGEKWLYTGAIYEDISKPILPDLIRTRYCADRENWQDFKEKNDAEIHWADFRKEAKKRDVINRWLEYAYNDCFGDRNFHFSILGINLSNLNVGEFDTEQNFNSIYNRFFRSMLKHSLKKYFGRGVVIDEILHEQGPQQDHKYFDWHTIYKLDQEEGLNVTDKPVNFLPKTHRKDERSNVIQFVDVLLGIFKDLHLGVNQDSYQELKKRVLEHKFVSEILIDRVVNKPLNINSSFGYANRFDISLFPNRKTEAGSQERLLDSYYDISKVKLEYLHQHQRALF